MLNLKGKPLGSWQSRFDLRMPVAQYVLILAILALLGCDGQVFLSIAGPPEWESAIVRLNGIEIARMKGVKQEGEESFSSSGAFVKVPLARKGFKPKPMGSQRLTPAPQLCAPSRDLR